jgi:hypothetical protein
LGSAKFCERKGRKPLVFQILLVLSWFGAEFIAGIIYGIVLAMQHGGQPPEFDMTIYLVALLGAGAAAGFWFLVAYLMPPGQMPLRPAIGPYAGPPAQPFGPPPTFGPPSDPNNPYAPPRSRN